MKDVLLIFKTHLDIGFTDYAENVLQKYLTQYIPNAIKVGYELKDSDTPFVWTLGSWLVWQALKEDADGVVEQAIRDGILCWHALPFTTHTELMSQKLFDYGVSLSHKLDMRFGKKTVGAKMTDVPGHTKGMIPVMNKYGIRFLHIGVNPATPVPSVPRVFRWKNAESEIVVMYEGDYGKVAEFDDFVLYFAHTRDNLGPQSAEEIREKYREIAERYPGSRIIPATIDDVAQRALAMPNLPVIEEEIGDTWIHGASTDPQKMSRYRKVLRHLETSEEWPEEIADHFLCVPEHTWGMDVKTHFPYDRFYTHQEMETLGAEREKIEASWREQREYVARAEALLGVQSDYPIQPPELSLYEQIPLEENLPCELSWQLFDRADYERYQKDYMRTVKPWALWDFTKFGLPDYRGGIFKAKPAAAYRKGEERLYRLEFDQAVAEAYGLPYAWLSVKGEEISLRWFGKKPSRLPQAFWLKFRGLEENWLVQKMGEWISPDDIVGSPLICAVDKGVKNSTHTLESLDCALVAPYGRKLLHYGEKDLKKDLYFNLYNNIWNTNFPMWYEDDAMFRFLLKNN